MRKIILFLFLLFITSAGFSQIPTSVQGKWRGFKQPAENIDNTTLVLIESKRIVFYYFASLPIVYSVEKTDIPNIYKVTPPESKKPEDMHMYVDKEGVLHMMWYNADGVTTYAEYRFKKESSK